LEAKSFAEGSFSMALFDQSAVLFVALLAMLLITVELGTRLGHRLSVDSDQLRQEQLVAARDAIGLLLSLLLGFTLAMALSRFDQRKQLLVGEANSIDTAIVRAELLPDAQRGAMLGLLHEYVEARIQFSEARIDGRVIDSAMARTKQLQCKCGS
jgi:hypothetical protein